MNPAIVGASLEILKRWNAEDLDGLIVSELPSTAAIALANAIRGGGAVEAYERLARANPAADRLYDAPTLRRRWRATSVVVRASIYKQVKSGKLSRGEAEERYDGLVLDEEFCAMPERKTVLAWLKKSFPLKLVQDEPGGSIWQIEEGDRDDRLFFTFSRVSGPGFSLGTEDPRQGVRDLFSIPHLTGSKSFCLLDLASAATWTLVGPVIEKAMRESLWFARDAVLGSNRNMSGLDS